MSTETNSYRVLLVSLVNWDSLIEIPVMLNKGGCTVDVYCMKDSWVLQNQYYNKWIDAPENNEDFVNNLLQLVEKEGDNYNWIIPCDDIIIRLLNDRITDQGLFYKLMPLSKIEHRELLGSKAGFSNLCAKFNIKTPGYLIYTEGISYSEIVAKVGLPLLIKLDKSEGGFGIYKCDTAAELEENLAKVTNRENLVFQQFIKGYDVNTEVLYKNGILLVYSCSQTTRTVSKFGPSSERLYYQIPELEGTLQKVGRDFGLSGFGNVVFMYNELDKGYYLIETDIRPNAWMYYGQFMGNDFSKAVNNLINNKLELVRPEAKYRDQQLVIRLYKKDVYRCILEKDWSGLRGWMTNKDNCKQYIPKYDPKLLKACNRFLGKFFMDMVKGKMRSILGRK